MSGGNGTNGVHQDDDDQPVYSFVVESMSDMRGWTPEVAAQNTAACYRLAAYFKSLDDYEAAEAARLKSSQSHSNYAQKALQDELAILAGTPAGGRNTQINTSAFNLGQLVGANLLDRAAVEIALAGVAKAIGCDDDDLRAIRNGLEAGVKKPRELSEHNDEPDGSRHDACAVNGQPHAKSKKNSKPKAEPVQFPPPIPASKLREASATSWLWKGYLARGEVTLLSALWKSGKTTLLAHLLRSLELGGEFCGLPIQAGRVLYVTEEGEPRWAKRRDKIGIADHVEFIVRPFGAKSDWDAWLSFMDYVKGILSERTFDLVTFDTLADLWPVRDENDASQVQAALKPLHKITGNASLLLVHHNRKGDGTEATASRGSGALTAFVDTIMELRRFDPADRNSRKRVLSGYGRDDDTTQELVIELTELDGYKAHGNREESTTKDLTQILLRMLPASPPGCSTDDLLDEWEGPKPRKQRLLEALRKGVDDGVWKQSGTGHKGSPFLYWLDAAVL